MHFLYHLLFLINKSYNSVVFRQKLDQKTREKSVGYNDNINYDDICSHVSNI